MLPSVCRRCRCSGVHQHHFGDLIGVAGGEGEYVEAAEGMARHHIRSWNVSPLQQRVEVGRYLCAVLGGISGRAPPATCTIVDADPGVTGDGRRNPPENRRHPAATRFEHDCGAA
jgi:hypothetical protein